MEDDLKDLLERLYSDRRDDFAIVYRLLYEWKKQTSTVKGFAQLLSGEQLIEDQQEFKQLVTEYVDDLDVSLANCLSISNALPIE